jgi:hypothetical protein
MNEVEAVFSYTTCAGAALFLARRYKGMACELHAPPADGGSVVGAVGKTARPPVVLTDARNAG